MILLSFVSVNRISELLGDSTVEMISIGEPKRTKLRVFYLYSETIFQVAFFRIG